MTQSLFLFQRGDTSEDYNADMEKRMAASYDADPWTGDADYIQLHTDGRNYDGLSEIYSESRFVRVTFYRLVQLPAAA